jgi:hypothetical protein
MVDSIVVSTPPTGDALEAFCSDAARLVRAGVLERFRPDTCILTVRALLDVCSYFGVPARALAARVQVYNAAMAAVVRAHGLEPPRDVLDRALAAGAWSVAVGYPPQPPAPPAPWYGHLVAVVGDDLLVDPSLDQASRPQKGIAVPVPVLFRADPGGLSGRRATPLVGPDGTLVLYDALPDERGHRRTPDWTDEVRRRRIVGDAVRALKDDRATR